MILKLFHKKFQQATDYLANPRNWLFLIFVFFLFSIVLLSYLSLHSQNEFGELAWSFANGKTYLFNDNLYLDTVLKDNHRYWPLAPFPSIIILPFALVFQKPFSQDIIHLFLNIILFYLIFRLVNKKFNFSKNDSLWLAIAYFFASIYIVICLSSLSYYFAHLIATLLIVLALLEFYGSSWQNSTAINQQTPENKPKPGKKRYWLIGILFALVFMTRFTAGLGVFFFIFLLALEKITWQEKIKKLFLLGLPIFFAGLLLLSYNYLRFNTPWENGYRLANQDSDRYLINKYGLFNPIYIPTNFYYYFIKSFIPYTLPLPANNEQAFLQAPYITTNRAGAISFFIISPLFILLYKANWRNKQIFAGLLTSGLILLILLSYYYLGAIQIGPRYLNDALPLLFICLLLTLPKTLNLKHKLLIAFSSLLNCYLFYMLFLTRLLEK